MAPPNDSMNLPDQDPNEQLLEELRKNATAKYQPGPGTLAMHVSILTVLMVSTIGGSVAMIAVIACNRALRTVTSMFIVSLAVSDLLVGLVVIPINFAVPTALFYGYTTCIYSACFTTVVCLSSMANIFAVTIDRYIAITHPFRYQTLMTPTRAVFIIVTAWLYALVLGFLPVMGWRATHSTCYRGETYHPYYVLLIFVSGCILPVWGSGVLYLRIFSTARKQARQIKEAGGFHVQALRAAMASKAATGSPTNRDSPEISQVSSGLSQLGDISKGGSGNSRRNRKAFKTIALMLLYFELSWLPVFSSMIIDAFFSPRILPAWTHSLFGILAFVNSAMDPIIYGYRNREIRFTFKRNVAAILNKTCKMNIVIPVEP